MLSEPKCETVLLEILSPGGMPFGRDYLGWVLNTIWNSEPFDECQDRHPKLLSFLKGRFISISPVCIYWLCTQIYISVCVYICIDGCRHAHLQLLGGIRFMQSGCCGISASDRQAFVCWGQGAWVVLLALASVCWVALYLFFSLWALVPPFITSFFFVHCFSISCWSDYMNPVIVII